VVARFTSNFATLLIGAGLLTSTFAFSSVTVGWVALGAGAATVTVALWAFALRGPGRLDRWLDVAVCAVGAWTIAASRCYGPGPGRWLAFASGAGLAGLGAIGLLVREARLASVLGDAQARLAPEQLRLSTAEHDGARS
jgi:hypothetical protein